MSEEQILPQSTSQSDQNASTAKDYSTTFNVSETLKQSSIEQAIARLSSSSKIDLIGKWACTDGWFVKKKLLGGYDGFKATDVCWIYTKKITQKTNFMTTGHNWTILMKLRSGREVETPCGWTAPKNHSAPPDAVLNLQRLQRALPWAMAGFAPYLAECWRKNLSVFLNVVDKRIDAIIDGLKSGSLKIRQDGTLIMTIQYFTLPDISVEVKGSGRGAKRIYEASG